MNLARGRPVTTSAAPVAGKAEFVTDGRNDADPAALLVLPAGRQWVQVDLGGPREVYAVALWHRHDAPRIYKGVRVDASDDPEFKAGVECLFDADR
jgi:hypothetical protein